MPAKKNKTKDKVKAKKPVAKTVAKKPVAKKTIKKPIAKTAAKKPIVKKMVKKVEQKIKKPVKKPVAKFINKSSVKTSKIKAPAKIVKPTKIAKKEEKKIVEKKLTKAEKASKLKLAKNKAANIETSAKIIAKAKTAHENKGKTAVVEAVPEKKSEAQKNLIIVKKLIESRSKVAFKIGDFAVYPSHGVGKITEIEKTSVLGQDFSCYLMYFEKEKLMIKIPVNSAEKIGLRHLVSKSQMDEVFSILRSGVKKLKGMWSRRAQEYETKINSGDIMLLAEVLRDLTRDIEDGERSYSERIIYETAVHRLAAEYSVIYAIEFEEAKDKVISTAKDKLGIEGKINQKDEFDEFDYDREDSDGDDEEESDDEEEEDDFDYNIGGGDDDDYDDDDDDDKPKKRKKKK